MGQEAVWLLVYQRQIDREAGRTHICNAYRQKPALTLTPKDRGIDFTIGQQRSSNGMRLLRNSGCCV